MAQFHRVNNDNVIGGAARVLVAPSSYALPTDLAHIVAHASTYAPNGTYGWADIGTTKSASNIAMQAATNEWRGEQQGPIRMLYTDYTGTATFEMEELAGSQGQSNKLLAGAVAGTAAAGQTRTDWTARNTPPDEVHICFLREDPDGRLHATIAPRAQWDGSALQRQFTRGESESLALPMKLYGDTDNTGADGNPLIFYDLDSD